MDWREQAKQDGYITCDECGHVVENGHNHTGCHAVDGCRCKATWTKTQIRQARQSLGLPATFDPSRLH